MIHQVSVDAHGNRSTRDVTLSPAVRADARHVQHLNWNLSDADQRELVGALSVGLPDDDRMFDGEVAQKIAELPSICQERVRFDILIEPIRDKSSQQSSGLGISMMSIRRCAQHRVDACEYSAGHSPEKLSFGPLILFVGRCGRALADEIEREKVARARRIPTAWIPRNR